MNKPEEIFVLNKTLKLAQAPGGFRTGLDSVMLAAACPASPGAHVLDLGCGVGSAGLCILKRVPDTSLTGIDIQADHTALAAHNAAMNDMSERAMFIASDIREVRDKRFDHVICNPPYEEAGKHLVSPEASKAIARGLSDTTLKDWIQCAFDAIQGQGSLTMIHKAGMVDKILQAMGKRFGGSEIIPLWPRANEAAKRVIIRSYKHKKSPATVHPGLILHEAHGDYTPAADKILKDGAALY